MNRERIARAYEKIAEGYAELALAYADEQPVAGESSPPRSPAPVSSQPIDPYERVNDKAQSAATWDHCPKHGKPFTDGRYGPYCASTSDEPDWANNKGYCNIKPSNAAAYARKHALPA